MPNLLIILYTLWLASPAMSDGSQVKADAAVHAFHVSKCQVEYNEGEQALQISLNLFIDDLEEALRRQGAGKLQLCTPREAPDAENHLQRYLRRHFIIRVNGKALDYTFIGKEISEDQAAVWCYLEITNVQKFRELSVTNNLLLEVFEDQKNIVSIAGPGKKQGVLLFQEGKETESLTF